MICYDLKYALRLCSEHDKHRACVHIYSTMGLYEEAVDLALKVQYVLLNYWCHIAYKLVIFLIESEYCKLLNSSSV